MASLGLAAYALILTLTRPLPAIELPARAARTASVVLLVIGVCFALLWLSSIVGALVASAEAGSPAAKWLGLAAVALASVNIFGGFAVTERMLAMYKKKERK